MYYSTLQDWNLLKERCCFKGTLKPIGSGEGGDKGISPSCECRYACLKTLGEEKL